MRIAILHGGFNLGLFAGITTVVFNITRGLVAKRHEVHVLTHYEKLPKKQEVEGFYLHRCFGGWGICHLGDLVGVLGSLKRIREIDPDVVLSMQPQLTGLLAKKFLAKPTIMWGQGAVELTSKNIVMRLLLKPCLKSADIVLALTQKMKGDLQRICDRDILILPIAVDTDRFKPELRQNARQRFGMKEEEKIILCVSHLRPEKGVEYLVQAVEDIAAGCPEARLFVVGKDFLKGRIQKLAYTRNMQEKITFTSFVPYNEIPDYMAAADIFVLPSLDEGFPNVLLEAMASGLPIVATNVGGIPEVIKDGENGFLVEPRNSHQLAEKILFLLQNEDVRKRFSRHNIEKAKSYSWSTVVDSLEGMCLKVRKH